MYEAFVIDDPLEVEFLFNPSRAGEGFRVCIIMLNFTCCAGVLFAKEAQTLFQHKLAIGKRKTFGLLQFEEYLPRVNVFWTLVKDFMDT